MREGGLGFRRFLPESLRLNELAGLKSEEPAPTPPRPTAETDGPARHGGPPTHTHRSKRTDFGRSEKKTAKPRTVTRRWKRTPAYIWRSKKSQHTRSEAADFAQTTF